MNYKNNIYLISFFIISLYVLCFYLSNLYMYQQLINNTITKDIYLNKTFFYTLLLISFTIATLYISKKTENKIREKKELNKKSRLKLEMINDFYTILQEKKGLKQTSQLSLEFLTNHFKAHSGVIYITNYKNLQLQLLNTYNEELSKVNKVMNIYRGISGEAFSTKKIKLYFKKAFTLVAIPLISNSKVVGILQLKFLSKIESFEPNKKEQTIIKIVANNLLKNIEEDKNQKYIELIDKYVLISSTNKEGEITYASEAFCKETGYTKDELIGNTHRILRDPKLPNSFFKDLWVTALLGKKWEAEMPNMKKDGSRYWTKTNIYPKYDFYNNITGFDAIRVDITDKKHIEKISITDALTKLYNRRYFDQIFSQQVKLASRLDKKMVFCLLDIDHFKQYNDTYGHQMGDVTLKKVASCLKSSLKRDTDFVFRLGGEEFGAIFFIKNDIEASNTANLIRKNIESLKLEHEKNTASKFVTVSCGVYIKTPHDKVDTKTIYKSCDDLLYKSKQQGRNQITTNLV